MTLPRTTLLAALHRTHFRSTTLALAVAGGLLVVITFVTLRTQVNENLSLVARTIAYASEAAVMFADAATAQEILTQIAEREHLAEAVIVTADGGSLARHERPPEGTADLLGRALGRLIFPEQTVTEIHREQRVLGRVMLRGEGTVFAGFFLRAVIAGLISFGVAVIAARRLAMKMERRIVAQLDALASLAHAANLNKDFERLLPAFNVVEFDQLGKDFNALLGEIQARNAELLARQSNLEQANASLSHLALHDSLTGLANRLFYNDRLEHALADARLTGSRIGVIYLDCDYFKEINDRLGHAAGDELLVDLGRRIRGAIRDSDLVARIGGDEFSVLLASLRDTADAIRVAGKIINAMKEPILLKDEHIVPTVSIGIAIFPDHGQNAGSLLLAADHAMYQAKHSGRNCYRIYTPAINSMTKENT